MSGQSSGGLKRDPTVSENEYHLQDVDESTFPHFYGFTNELGAWYIIRENSNGELRYARASIQTIGEYSDKWNSRTDLIYTYWWSSF